MKKLQIQKIEAVGGKTSEKILWNICLSILLTAGGTHIIFSSCEREKLLSGLLVLMEIAGIVCVVLAQNLKQKTKYAYLFYLLPWVMLFLFTRGGYLNGGKAWINTIIMKWNQAHEGGVALFLGNASEHEIQAFLCLITLLATQISCFLVWENHLIGEIIYCLVFSAISLVSGEFNAMVAGFLTAGVIGTWMTCGKKRVAKKTVLWTALIGVVLGICALLIPDQKMPSIVQFQENVKETVHDLRYGKSQLPEGDLRRADELKQNPQEMLQVQSEQEKALYLYGYTGGRYEDGVWLTLPDSAYGGDNAGLMEWLTKESFDPLTQVAKYYELSEEDTKPEENEITVFTKTASRDHMYVPATMSQVTKGKVQENNDQDLKGKGFFGQFNCTLEERSGTRPSELTVAQDWISNPKTKAQKKYVQAEAVYRQFVYEEYTSIDQKMNELMQEVFWKDYDSESDGIYSAVTQIRKVLKQQTSYTETPKTAPDEIDPIQYFLTESGEGNAMLYASTVVEALRAHGIPARYAEGYYLSANQITSGGAYASVTGQDTHAWAEVYFDGIGWLPIDVTPGYYYDAVALQQMVNTPDMVHKNAALDPNSYQSASVTDSEGKTKSLKEKAAQVARVTATVVLGIVGFLFILGTLFFGGLEIRHQYYIWKFRKRYNQSDAMGRVALAEEQIFRILDCMGIHASLGWETDRTDQILSERFEQIKAQSYKRTCSLLEKSIYGEMELEPYEERTVNTFIERLYEAGKTGDWKLRLKIRYTLTV